jgi:hypothetical protein
MHTSEVVNGMCYYFIFLYHIVVFWGGELNSRYLANIAIFYNNN